ncbi:DNA helicase IV [Vibrio sp. SCSIO 43136]|uniref:DNA helicase IV n=1 Tax=Vibrio sp. SCSIO 43136 TaxID=2819101 RepID=UPI002074DF30|nr:DNA helicase IV [Vibrio sp. SCSIO 43136]USD68278.1 DNA helicase IV [Vibrio sp. SCSIO 43136]
MQLSASHSAQFFIQTEYNQIRIENNTLTLSSVGSDEIIPFSAWSGKVTLSRGLVWGQLGFHSHVEEGRELIWQVQGLPWPECKEFAYQAQALFKQWHHAQCEKLNTLLPQWQESLVRMQKQPAYLATSELVRWQQSVESGLNELEMSQQEANQMMPRLMREVENWLDNGRERQQERNQTWLENEREYWQLLFERCESSPLNVSQQQAVLLNNDHNLVLAGAGTGKTSVLSARVAYLLQSHKAQPEQILLVAFGRDAAEEMRQRLDTRLGSAASEVCVKTFHSLGLDIIRQVDGQGVEISPIATNDKAKQAWCSEWLKQHWSAGNNFKRWQKHLSKWPIAYLKGDEELGSQSENPKLIAWLNDQLEQLNASQLSKKQVQESIVANEEYPRLNSELQLVWPCYQAWQTMLKESGHIDFHTMISRAAKYARNGKFKPQWQFIMVDEYQDISPARLELLDALCHGKSAQQQASLFAVGDDWQAIYRFAGSEVNLTTGFEARFPGATIHSLDTTYRFNNMIGEVASKFVLQNPNQLQKELNSHKTLKQKSVSLIPLSILEESLAKLNEKATTRKEVLLLGRNHYHIPSQLDEWQHQFSNLSLKFMTCHASKGREADVVFILNVDEGQFPAVERQAHLKDAMLSGDDLFPHAEERRLFYVALTRAKEKAFVVYGAHPSGFVDELRTGDYPVIKK